MPCPKLAEGEVVRITRVDDCGAPVVGPDNAFISECWAQVQMTANIEQGDDITFTSMSGRSCGFKRRCPDFRGYDIEGQFFEASPEQVEILTGNPVYFDHNGDPIGWDDCRVACRGGFALEVWQNVVGEECPEDGEAEGLWFYWLLPWVSNAVMGDVTIGNEGLTFTITGSTRNASRWGLGPWDIQAQDDEGTAGPLLTPLGTTCHRRGFLTTIAPPLPECGYQEVPPVDDGEGEGENGALIAA